MDRKTKAKSLEKGDLAVVCEANGVPEDGNLDGNGLRAFVIGQDNDSLHVIGFIRPETPLVVIEVPNTIIIKVMAPVLGPVYVAVKHLKHL